LLRLELIDPPAFVASNKLLKKPKLETFRDRGNHGFPVSRDFEDVITVIGGRGEPIVEIASSDVRLKTCYRGTTRQVAGKSRLS
jgi:hypothetical protein